MLSGVACSSKMILSEHLRGILLDSYILQQDIGRVPYGPSAFADADFTEYLC